MDKSRFRNYGLWISIAALIPMVLKGFDINILPSNFEEIVTAILSILVMLGIINNPSTQCKWYSDDGCKEEMIEEPMKETEVDKEAKETIENENSEGK